MNIVSQIKAAAGNIALATGLFSQMLQHQAKKNRSLTLMYHRILASHDTETNIEPGMFVTSSTFEMHLQFLKNYFTMVNLQTLLQNNHASGSSKPLCCLTFDDGWFDFKTNAFPLLKKHNIPATIFLPTNFIGTNRLFWTDVVGAALNYQETALQNWESILQVKGADTAECGIFVEKILLLKGTYEERLDAAVNMLKSQKPVVMEAVVAQLTILLPETAQQYAGQFLSWDDVVQLKKSGLVTFGSHTHNHYLLTSLDDNSIDFEIDKSKLILLQHNAVDPEFITFCYPNGNTNEHIAALVKKTGYHAAFTTRAGWNTLEHNRFLLLRLNVHEGISFLKGMFSFHVLLKSGFV